ncbi:MAG: hydroxymethylglutaryl-CoA reductase [Candidatus Marinimicrobia bacterium]|jgi:hydroxymethylglutaryl-CoA reductase (NADPH)|nr:hydroxymethylglutaryl-CoA reductase [Candidatus Neomarinimicrobiota bacterium]MBT3631135.1 hydroxymethylglutaryl-CoA reductase [Candidatus Neomarinimicrobiota bacterium]MBT3823501.1 hydroxymethylglutaryl-CoA reductase [Candidatus Neomarinimicrobiota bacterium]MBT4130393.1 hydroxymethylglutaryl-CoA reductase [Candidatus Neomarinimicrobiota bacterium]MBT4295109.1 hydroxymethylglutaryl-CoA reductase [Candidatus Neomarinimicrobiota bacterium]
MSELNNGRNSHLPRGYSPKDSLARKEWVKNFTGVEIDDTLKDDVEDLQGIIEHHVGTMNVPMAVVGPLAINGTYANGDFIVPLCTLEGSLAASMNRGIYAATVSGGTTVRHFRQELSRAPVFIFNNIIECAEFQQWVTKNQTKIMEVAESTTKHGKVLRIDQYTIQNYVVLDLVMDTNNAAGQNMVTLAAQVACEYIQAETNQNYFLESNFNSDKKASTRNMLLGRGHAVSAETTIKNSVMRRILKMDPDILFDSWSFFPTISSLAGTHGNGLHVSNALTAIYLATGQDTACAAENSIAHLGLEKVEDGITFKLTLPSLTVGTVGGGTRLKMQNRNLAMLGCAEGEHASRKLAEIIAAATLSLEISLICAIGSHTWTDAHMKYGRK